MKIRDALWSVPFFLSCADKFLIILRPLLALQPRS
jgi:hypothetical protein